MTNPTELQIHDLYIAGKIQHATWCNALRALRGERAGVPRHPLRQAARRPHGAVRRHTPPSRR